MQNTQHTHTNAHTDALTICNVQSPRKSP